MHLLFVCTGNICRSPLAERLSTAFATRTLGEQAGGLTAESAGVGALVGNAMDPDAADVLTHLAATRPASRPGPSPRPWPTGPTWC